MYPDIFFLVTNGTQHYNNDSRAQTNALFQNSSFIVLLAGFSDIVTMYSLCRTSSKVKLAVKKAVRSKLCFELLKEQVYKNGLTYSEERVLTLAACSMGYLKRLYYGVSPKRSDHRVCIGDDSIIGEHGINACAPIGSLYAVPIELYDSQELLHSPSLYRCTVYNHTVPSHSHRYSTIDDTQTMEQMKCICNTHEYKKVSRMHFEFYMALRELLWPHVDTINICFSESVNAIVNGFHTDWKRPCFVPLLDVNLDKGSLLYKSQSNPNKTPISSPPVLGDEQDEQDYEIDLSYAYTHVLKMPSASSQFESLRLEKTIVQRHRIRSPCMEVQVLLKDVKDKNNGLVSMKRVQDDEKDGRAQDKKQSHHHHHHNLIRIVDENDSCDWWALKRISLTSVTLASFACLSA